MLTSIPTPASAQSVSSQLSPAPSPQPPAPKGLGHGLGWLGIGGIALTLRLLVAWLAGGFHHPQVFEYHSIATALLAGKGFVYASHGGVLYYSFDAPLYPWLCALVYALTRTSVPALLVVQMVASAWTAMLIRMIGESLWGRGAGTLAGLLVACHPGLIVYASLKAHALTFDAFWFTLACWQCIRLSDERTLRRAVWAGLTFGLALLQRPTVFVFFPVAVAWLFETISRQEWRAEARRVGLMTGCAFLVILPWLVRGMMIHRQFVFIRSTNWEVFWRGNNPQATGHSYVDANQTVLETLSPALHQELERLPNEMAQARWFRDQALAFIRAHPRAFVRLTLMKFFYFWWHGPQTGTLYARTWRIGYQLFYAFALAFALAGMLDVAVRGSVRQRQAAVLIGACLLALSIGQSLHYVEGRHRWAIESLLLLFSGVGIVRLIGTVQRVRSARVAATSP